MTLRGFGTLYDLQTGTSRLWYMGSDGIKRWMDNDQPVENMINEGVKN